MQGPIFPSLTSESEGWVIAVSPRSEPAAPPARAVSRAPAKKFSEMLPVLPDYIMSVLPDFSAPDSSTQLTKKPRITKDLASQWATSSLKSASLPVTGSVAGHGSKAMTQIVAGKIEEGLNKIGMRLKSSRARDLEAAEYEATSDTESETLPFSSMLQLLSDIDGKQYYFDKRGMRFMSKQEPGKGP